MDRNSRRDDRGGRRDEPRNSKPRYERERSRSPQHRERRNDRRRSRSPPRGGRNGPSDRYDDYDRSGPRNPSGRQDSRTPEPSRAAARGGPRGQQDSRANGSDHRPGKTQSTNPRDVHMGDTLEDEDSEAEMQRVMGFKDFRTTKDTKVPGNDRNYAVSKVKKAEYRQYMNRVGGFNRPLSPGRDKK